MKYAWNVNSQLIVTEEPLYCRSVRVVLISDTYVSDSGKCPDDRGVSISGCPDWKDSTVYNLCYLQVQALINDIKDTLGPTRPLYTCMHVEVCLLFGG